MKVSERGTKTTLPGRKQVWRLTGERWWEADLIVQADEPRPEPIADLIGYHPLTEYEWKRYEQIRAITPLLAPVIEGGEIIAPQPALEQIRRRTREQLAQLHPTSRRLLNPHIYKVSISEETLRIRRELREQVMGEI